MKTYRCFKDNCHSRQLGKCNCEEETLSCKDHVGEHLFNSTFRNHNFYRISLKPADEIKQPLISKLTELKKDIQIYKKKVITEASEIIINFKATFGKYMDQINEVDKRCSRIIEILHTGEEILDVFNKNDIENVLKLNAQEIKKEIAGWSIDNCDLDCKEINTTISEIYGITFDPFKKTIENHIESNELSFFRHNTSNFATINLDNFQISSTQTLETQETISAHCSKCILPDETYFYCCSYKSNSGLAFTIGKGKNVTQMQKSKNKSNNLVDSIFHYNFVYLLGGQSKLAERYDLEKNIWESLAPLPQGLDFNGSRTILFKDWILIAAAKLDKMIIYTISQNNYKDVSNLVLNGDISKLLLSGNNRIYVIEKGQRIFESAKNDISSWMHIGSNSLPNGCYELQSIIVRYKESLYFVECNDELWKFDLKSKQLAKVATV